MTNDILKGESFIFNDFAWLMRDMLKNILMTNQLQLVELRTLKNTKLTF